MRTFGRTIYLLTNLGLCIFYGYEILKYFQGVYNYDGMRYFIPIAIADILLLISLVLLYFTDGFSKELVWLLGFGLLHNVAHGCGVERIPFIGFIIATISLFYLVKLFSKHSSQVGAIRKDN